MNFHDWELMEDAVSTMADVHRVGRKVVDKYLDELFTDESLEETDIQRAKAYYRSVPGFV